MKKIKWESIRGYAEQLCEVASYLLVYTAANKGMKYLLDCGYKEPVGYDDAVQAIMHSGMYSHDKANAVSALKRDGDTEFYKAIVHIAKSSGMYSHDKVNMIEQLSQD